jgi:hypothetical protein
MVWIPGGKGKVKRKKEIHTRGLMLESKRQALRETQTVDKGSGTIVSGKGRR